MLLILAALAQAALDAGGARRALGACPSTRRPRPRPRYDATTAYVPLRGGALVAVDLDRGQVRWRRELATTLAPSVGGGLVFVAGDGVSRRCPPIAARPAGAPRCPAASSPSPGTPTGCCARTRPATSPRCAPATASLVWRVSLGAALVLPPAPGLDRVYVGIDGGRLISLDLATGQHVWERTLPGRITGLAAGRRPVDCRHDRQRGVQPRPGDRPPALALARGWRRGRRGGERRPPCLLRGPRQRAARRRSPDRQPALDRGPARPAGRRPAGAQRLRSWCRCRPPSASSIRRPGKPAAQRHRGRRDGRRHRICAWTARPTSPRLVAVTLDGRMQGFGWRYEEPPARLAAAAGAGGVPPE